MADNLPRLRRVQVHCNPPLVGLHAGAYHVVYSYWVWECITTGPDAQPWQRGRAQTPEKAYRVLQKKLAMAARQDERAQRRARAGLES